MNDFIEQITKDMTPHEIREITIRPTNRARDEIHQPIRDARDSRDSRDSPVCPLGSTWGLTKSATNVATWDAGYHATRGILIDAYTDFH